MNKNVYNFAKSIILWNICFIVIVYYTRDKTLLEIA